MSACLDPELGQLSVIVRGRHAPVSRKSFRRMAKHRHVMFDRGNHLAGIARVTDMDLVAGDVAVVALVEAHHPPEFGRLVQLAFADRPRLLVEHADHPVF